MAAVPMLVAGVGLMMMCCSSSSIAFLVMGDEEKKVPDGNDTADEAQAKADAVAADPNSTPAEVAAAQAEAAATPTPPPPPTPSTVRGKAIGGYYKTFAECWTEAEGDWGHNGKFNCCERLGKTPYPARSDGEGWHFCYDNT